jgi:hypothetical protein
MVSIEIRAWLLLLLELLHHLVWQIMSGPLCDVVGINLLSRSAGVDYATIVGGGLIYWNDGL